MTRGLEPGKGPRHGLRHARERRRRWADLLRGLRSAYAEGDVASIRALWYRAIAEPGLGFWLRLSNRFYPLQSLLDVSYELERRIGEEGLARASRWLLDTGIGDWRSEVPPKTRAVLAAEPVILYGNHPSLLTPFLVSAHVEREDYRIVAASFLEKFLPTFGRYAISVELPLNRWWLQLWQGGLRRLVVVYWATRLRPVLPRPTARARNREAMARAAAHVRGGGALLIAPSGWSRSDRRWYPGLGRIVQELGRDPGLRPAFLVPYREEGTSDRLVRGLLEAYAGRPRPPTGERPPTVRFGEPLPLSQLAAADAQEVVRDLRQRYAELLPGARARLPARLRGPSRA
ncbi:MAG: hypothetical protein N2320_01130 [Candidatus Bipolaricaulota bacterium]|nr:hypothetical protein [Candidatus Bipolaricaulota bacterium]